VTPTAQRAVDAGATAVADDGPVEFDRVVPPSGNLSVARRQFWLGPARAGQTVRFWASVGDAAVDLDRAASGVDGRQRRRTGRCRAVMAEQRS
jgi:hypothetical protein